MADVIKATATGRYYHVYADGVEVSQHTAEREAVQQCVNLLFNNPTAVVVYDHEYRVNVVLTTAGITLARDLAAPPPNLPPTINSTPAPFFSEGTADTYDTSQDFTDDGQSTVVTSLTTILPNGLSYNGNTHILSYDGIGIPSVSTHTLKVDDQVNPVVESSSFNITIDTSTFFVPNILFIDDDGNQTHDLNQYYSSLIPAGSIVNDINLSADSSALPSGVTIDVLNENLVFTDSAGGVGSASNVRLDVDVSSNAEADWAARISAPGVVAYHDFQNEAEVNQFRRQAKIQNDVSGKGDGNTRWIGTDSVTGGGCLEINIPANGVAKAGWVRPFSALTGATNGRGIDDPGSTLRSWDVVDGTNYVGSWKHDYISHVDEQPAEEYDFLGDEIFIQFRCKVSTTRTLSSQPSAGKLVFIMTCGNNGGSFITPSQEIVFRSQRSSQLRAYTNFASGWNGGLTDPQASGDTSGAIKQPGGAFNNTCIDNLNCTKCYCWPTDEWFTYYIRLKPGHNQASSDLNNPATQDTEFEIKICEAGDTSYTTIYSKNDFVFDFSDQIRAKGWNCFIPSGFMNGVEAGSQGFFHRYDQVIFSKQPIACPQA